VSVSKTHRTMAPRGKMWGYQKKEWHLKWRRVRDMKWKMLEVRTRGETGRQERELYGV